LRAADVRHSLDCNEITELPCRTKLIVHRAGVRCLLYGIGRKAKFSLR
jgi:hypothetical protein